MESKKSPQRSKFLPCAPPPQQEIADRIRAVMEARDLNPIRIEELSEERGLKIPRSTLSDWLNEGVEPGAFRLAMLAQILEVPIEYLIYGAGVAQVFADVVDRLDELLDAEVTAATRTEAMKLVARTYVFLIGHKIRGNLVRGTGKVPRIVVDSRVVVMPYTSVTKYAEKALAVLTKHAPHLKKEWDSISGPWTTARNKKKDARG